MDFKDLILESSQVHVSFWGGGREDGRGLHSPQMSSVGFGHHMRMPRASLVVLSTILASL